MKRKEEIIQAGINYTLANKPRCIAGDNFADVRDEFNRNLDFERGAEWSDAHPHWISVEDELPKETNMYIVVHYNVVCTMWWYDGVEEWAEIYVDENEDICSRRMENITHWMPLPQPPKKGEEQ